MDVAISICISLEDLPDQIVLHILSRLDGPSLAAVGCSSKHLHRLSSSSFLWLNLCLSTYPSLLLHSLPFSPRSFFSLAFPLPSSSPSTKPFPDFIFSFVDLRHCGTLILSRIIAIETRSALFLSTPFRLDVIDDDLRTDQTFSPVNLELSWVMADQTGNRAMDMSSRKPVSVEMHWFSGDLRVQFAMVVGEGGSTAVIATVICSGVGLTEVKLMVENADGVPMNGRESMEVIWEMMDGGRRGWRRREEEAKQNFVGYVRKKNGILESEEGENCWIPWGIIW